MFGFYEVRAVVRSKPALLMSGALCLAVASCSVPAEPALFTDVTQDSGFDVVHERARIREDSGGTSLADVDGDGRLDIFVARAVSNGGGASALYLNRGGWKFQQDQSPELSQALAGFEATCAAFTDLDNDGDPDLLVGGLSSMRLLKNDGMGGFTRVDASFPETEQAMGITVADFDGDGLPDPFVARFPAEMGDHQSANSLFRNLGDWSFERMESEPSTDQGGYSWGASWFDFDGDRDLDLYVVNDTFTSPWNPEGSDRARPDCLYENLGDGQFRDAAHQYGLDLRRSSMGLGLGDLNSDQRPDLAVTDIGTEHLYLSEEGGGWRHLASDPNEDTAWASVFFDFNQDGIEDLLTTRGDLQYTVAESRQSVVKLGQPGGQGREFRTVNLHVRAQHNARGVSVGDLDNDGDGDVVLVGFDSPYLLLRNDAPSPGLFLRIIPIGNGESVSRDAIGTVATVATGAKVMYRQLVVTSIPNSGHERVLHFGVGSAKQVEFAVTWPDGSVCDQPAVETGKTYVMRQGTEDGRCVLQPQP